jgi:hypothetical protein
MLSAFFDKSKALQFFVITIYFLSIQGLYLYLNELEIEFWEVFLSDIVFLSTISVFWTILYKQKFLGYKSSFFYLFFILFSCLNPQITLNYKGLFLVFAFLFILARVISLTFKSSFQLKLLHILLISFAISFLTPAISFIIILLPVVLYILKVVNYKLYLVPVFVSFLFLITLYSYSLLSPFSIQDYLYHFLNFSFNFSIDYDNDFQFFLVTFLFLVSLFSISFSFFNLKTFTAKERYYVILVCLIFSFLFYFLKSDKTYSDVLLFFPMMLFFFLYLFNSLINKYLKDALIIIFTLLPVANLFI